MAFDSAGVSTIQSESFARRQQQQNQESEQADLFFQQQLKSTAENDAANALPSTCVAPSALTTVPEAAPSIISDRRSSVSAPSSRGWQDSPVGNTLSSPATSITSPHSSLVSPPVDPRILIPPQDAKPRSQQPVRADEPVETAETPKRRRGRPRLSEASNTRDTRATRAAATAKKNAPGATTQQKAAAARRASTASASGADDSKNDDTAADKKSRVRARNREAAYKCRQKKQKGIEELQTQEAVAEDINKTLHSEAAMLRSEVLMLKNMVLQHGGCRCSYIEEYVSGAAQNLVHSSMAASSAQTAAGGAAINAQSAMNGSGGDSYVDWKMFDIDRKPGNTGLGSESGFSALDDTSVTHSARAPSQGVTKS